MDKSTGQPRKENTILRFIDWFIPVDVQADKNKRLKYRIFIGACWSSALVLVAAIFINRYAYDLPERNQQIGLFFTIPLTFIYLIQPFIIKRYNYFRLAVNTVLLGLTIGILAGTGVSGGPLVSMTSFLLIIPPTLGFFLGGFRTGIVWTLGIYTILAAACFADIYGFQYTNLTAAESFKTNQMVNLAIGFVTIILIIIIYEYTNNQLYETLQQQKDRYKSLASHDPLTGSGNRFLFYKQLEKTWHRAKRHQQQFAVLFIDLDKFKRINDQYGHDIGDAVLVTINQRLEDTIRNSDTLCRIGGDEFTIILDNLTEPLNLDPLLKRIDAIFKVAIPEVPGPYMLGASIGIAIYPDDTTELAELSKIADERMYKMKNER